VHLGRAGDSSVVVAIEPLITAVAAAVFLREHIPGRRWLGFLIGMSGIALLNGAWRLDLHTPALLANLVFLSSFVCETTYSVIGKPLLEQTSPLKLVACSLFFGAAFNLPLDGAGALAAAPRLTAAHWASLAFLVVVCTLIGYTLWYVVIRDCDVNLAAMTILVQPVFGVPLAAWFLGESLHWGQLWGTVVILVGLGIGLRRATRFLDPDFNGSDPGTGRRVPNGHTS
jgi:drug/metabolite transporter (DMT)-like permease